MSRWLICRTHQPDYCDSCAYALLEVTERTAALVDQMMEEAERMAESFPSFNAFSLWDYSLQHLDSLPEDWDEWGDIHLEEAGKWVELPPSAYKAAGDLDLSRTECEMAHASERGVYWSAMPKHTSFTVETGHFPLMTPTERLALLGEGND